MTRRAVWLPLLLGGVLVSPLLAVPELTADALKANRAELEQWRKHPEQLSRLRRDLRQFLALPNERREQILKLDDDLQQDKKAARLVNVLERYVSWLDQLPEADRRAIASTANITARLALIQDLRDREWMKTQPSAAWEKWKGLQGKPRTEFVHKLRQEERRRREEWQVAAHFWKRLHAPRPPATRLSELDAEDREGVVEYLMPMLSDEENQRLREAEGQWPTYLMTLVELADRHPLAMLSARGPRTLMQLPREVRKRLHETMTDHPVNPVRAETLVIVRKDAQWPALAVNVVGCYKAYVKKPLPRELWAYNEDCLLPPMREYMQRLRAVLTDKEKERLDKAANNWPAYPIAIQELAQAHELPAPPWNTALSGPRERWDDLRTASNNDVLTVPRQVLQEFALFKLEPAKVAKLRKLPPPEMWRQLHAELMRHGEAHGPAKLPRFEPREKSKGRRFPVRHDDH